MRKECEEPPTVSNWRGGGVEVSRRFCRAPIPWFNSSTRARSVVTFKSSVGGKGVCEVSAGHFLAAA